MVTKLLSLMPDHQKYIEIFGGGASLLFAKKPTEFEVYNDLDSGLISFFRVLRDPDKFAKFYHWVSLTPYSREEYYDCRNTWETENDPIMKAYKWFVVAGQSFAGRFGSGWGFNVNRSYNGKVACVSGWQGCISQLHAVHQRMMDVQIEHNDFRQIIKTYESADCLFYFDPPYPHQTRTPIYYQIEMSDSDHEDLLQLIIATPAMVMLSSYPNDLYNETLIGWNKIEFHTACHAAGRTRNSKLQGKGNALKYQSRIEVVWRNPAMMKQIENGNTNINGRNDPSILWAEG